MKYGYEGLGLFYTALEKFAAQEKPIKTEALRTQLQIGKRLSKIFEFCEKIGIICSSNGESFSKELLNFSEKYKIKKQKTAERVARFRERYKNVTRYDCVSNAPKVKESKVNKIVRNASTKETVPLSVETVVAFIGDPIMGANFWDYYQSNGWKVGKNPMKDWKSAARRWKRMNQNGQEVKNPNARREPKPFPVE